VSPYNTQPTKRDHVERLYAEVVGPDALERQRADLRERHYCCGEPLEDGHHFACSKRPPDEPPALIDGQGALL
jgi:hypothetical protein